MTITDFDFALPDGLIAQHPAEPRDSSRLLVLDRASSRTTLRTFRDLPSLLSPGDLLVMNDTRVVAARLAGRRERTGGKWQGLFVRALSDGTWELLAQTRGSPSIGETLIAGDGLRLTLEARTPGGRWVVRPSSQETPGEILARFGTVPIPPYIRDGQANGADIERYQTLYAARDGAVAAPTAGLHFTEQVFADLEGRSIRRAFVTLHVGPGTFQPVKATDMSEHRVEPEWGEVPEETAAAIRQCRGRVVAVGTTTTRLLEQAASGGEVAAWSGLAGLTIVPPFEFRAVDALVTNFHLPRSSLLLLVSAFAGREQVMAAYAEAIRNGCRFYSYGDAMLIL